MRRVLIFDLDGTLVDSVQPAADLFCRMLEERCGVPDRFARPVYVSLLGMGPRSQFAEVLRRAELFEEALLEKLTFDYWTEYAGFEPKLFPEVPLVLDELRQKGHALAISSGGKTDLVAGLVRTLGIERSFDLVLGSVDGVAAQSKGPGHFEQIRRVFGLSEAELRACGVFVGDGVFDMQVARAAGVIAVGRVTAGNGETLRAAGAQHLIADLRELRPIVEAP